MAENWEGFTERECSEHRTTGGRAWCFDCSEWCYERVPCKGCERPQLMELLSAIWLYIDWHHVTKNLTTAQRTAFADAVDERSEGGVGTADRWWLSDG